MWRFFFFYNDNKFLSLWLKWVYIFLLVCFFHVNLFMIVEAKSKFELAQTSMSIRFLTRLSSNQRPAFPGHYANRIDIVEVRS